MTAVAYKTVPSHTLWKKDRDKAGGKSGLCSKVNVGKLLDGFEKVQASKKERPIALEKLKTGLMIYSAEPKVKAIGDLYKSVMSLIKCIELELLANKKQTDQGLAIGLTVGDGFKRIEKITAQIKAGKITEAQLDYERFWDGIGRGLGKDLPNGQLRTDWANVHGQQPKRENVGKIGLSDEDKKNMINTALGEYKAALHKLMKDAEEAGLTLKLA